MWTWIPSAPIAFNDLVGNLSYIILAASFFVTSIVWLRIWAAVAMLLEIAYFCMTSWDLYTGVAWDLVFIAINLYRLAQLMTHRRGVRNLRELAILRVAFAGLDDSQLSMLVTSGRWTRFDPGGRLLMQGRSGHRLHLICAGRAAVAGDAPGCGTILPGDVVGASGFLLGDAPRRSVIAETDIKALSFERDALMVICRRDPAIAAAIYRLMSCALARQLSVPTLDALPAARLDHFAV